MNLRKFFLIGILGTTLTLSLHALGQAPAQQQPAAPVGTPVAPVGTVDNPVRLNVSVDMVNIPAVVRDSSGRFLDGLKLDDFTVLENGVQQKLSFFAQDTLSNLSVGVLVDTSGSMRHKLQQALQMVREMSLALGPQDEMFLITFSDDVDVRQKFTKNPEDIGKALRGIRSGGETSVYDAVKTGVDEMKNAHNGKKVLFLVTDGYDTRSKMTMDQALDMLKGQQMQVYAVGIDDDDNDPLVLRQPRYHAYFFMLTEITSATGGHVFRMYTGRNYALDSIASVILEDVHQQYTLSYYPTTPKDGSWRKLEVKVDRPGAKIETRTGYYAIPQ